MRTIAFLTQKGGTGKTTLTASLAVAAADAGERVIAFDLDPQASLVHWGERRAASVAKKVLIEPLERDRLSRLDAILQGVSGAGFSLALFDTAGADAASIRLVTDVADLSCCRRAQRAWMWKPPPRRFAPSFWPSAKPRSF